jgi:hypothetical protein
MVPCFPFQTLTHAESFGPVDAAKATIAGFVLAGSVVLPKSKLSRTPLVSYICGESLIFYRAWCCSWLAKTKSSVINLPKWFL